MLQTRKAASNAVSAAASMAPITSRESAGISQEILPPQDCLRANAVAVTAIAQEIEASNVGIRAGSSSLKPLSSDLYGAGDSSMLCVGDVGGDLGVWALSNGLYDHDSITFSPCAGLDQKASWGAGQSLAVSPRCGAGTDAESAGIVGAASGAGSPSLDSLKNNRHTRTVPVYYQRPVGRGKFCGRWSVTGTDPKTGRKVYRRLNCGSWSCSYCGTRKARTARAAIRTKAEELGLKYFLTLTLDPKKLANKKFQVPYLRLCFNKFREYLKREFGVAPSYICVLEFTQKGVPHLHILFDRYIDQRWISRTWDSLGGGRIVFIKQVTVQNVARYLSKYLTKELLLSAPKGTRRITTARSIKLFPKFDSGIAWALVHHSIYRALEDINGREFFTREQSLFKYVNFELDEEKYLNKFEIVQEC